MNNIQALIDEGLAPKPEIFTDTETGTEAKIVDYKRYKQLGAKIQLIWKGSTSFHYQRLTLFLRTQ